MISGARKQKAAKKLKGRLVAHIEQSNDQRLKDLADICGIPIPHDLLVEKDEKRN